RPVHDERADAVRIEYLSHHVGRARQRLEHLEDAVRCVVAHHDVPFAVEDERRKRFLLPQDVFEGAAPGPEIGCTEGSIAVRRRVARGDEQRVALAERDVEHAGQQLHHLAARLRAARLEEAEMPCGDAGFGGERQLAHVPRVAPLPQHAAECGDAALREPKQRIHVPPAPRSPLTRGRGNYLSGKDARVRCGGSASPMNGPRRAMSGRYSRPSRASAWRYLSSRTRSRSVIAAIRVASMLSRMSAIFTGRATGSRPARSTNA